MFEPVLKLIAYIAAGWAVHAGLVALYLPRFKDTTSLVFRFLHGAEIGFVMIVAFLMYFKGSGNFPPLKMTLIVLPTLLAIDILVFYILWPEGRKYFDIWHFITAFTVVAGAILIAEKLAAKF